MGEKAWDWREVRTTCLHLAARFASRREDAEEIAQEAVIRAWRFRRSHSGGARKAWLAKIVRNEASRYFGRDAMGEAAALNEREGADDPGLASIPLRIDVRAALRRLEQDDRQLLILRYSEDLTQPAIAELMGLPEGTVKVRLHRARAKLAAALQDR